MKVLWVTATIMNTTKKMLLVFCLFVFCFFPIQTVVGSGYHGIESPLPYMHNLKTRRFFFELLSAACWLSRATGSQNGF